jgi:hypothetical protein
MKREKKRKDPTKRSRAPMLNHPTINLELYAALQIQPPYAHVPPTAYHLSCPLEGSND